MNNTEEQPAPASPAQPPAEPDAPQSPPPQEPPAAGWGAPPPPPPANRARWSVRRTVIAVAVAVGIAAAGGVAIYAASNSGSNDQVGGPGGGPGGAPGGGPGGNFNQRGGGPVMGGGLFGDTDHGEFQSGEVTAISDTSITAKSDDGYTQTYVIDSDTMMGDGIEKGDDVTIVASISSDDKATATMVAEHGQGIMPPRRDGQDGSPPTR